MHPTVPLGGYLRGIVFVANVLGKLDPTIASVEIVRILEVLVTVFVLSDQLSRLNVVVAETARRNIYNNKYSGSYMYSHCTYITRKHIVFRIRIVAPQVNCLPEQL